MQRTLFVHVVLFWNGVVLKSRFNIFLKKGCLVQKLFLIIFISLGICLVSGTVAAEIYKYVDADGKVYFTDAPPTGVAAEKMNVQPNTFAGGGQTAPRVKSSASATRTSLATAKQQPKVELFVTSWCGYCKQAEAYLRKKGIAFTVYDIEKDLRAAHRKNSLTARKGVPFALIGDQKVTGFSVAAYERALQKAR